MRIYIYIYVYILNINSAHLYIHTKIYLHRSTRCGRLLLLLLLLLLWLPPRSALSIWGQFRSKFTHDKCFHEASSATRRLRVQQRTKTLQWWNRWGNMLPKFRQYPCQSFGQVVKDAVPFRVVNICKYGMNRDKFPDLASWSIENGGKTITRLGIRLTCSRIVKLAHRFWRTFSVRSTRSPTNQSAWKIWRQCWLKCVTFFRGWCAVYAGGQS